MREREEGERWYNMREGREGSFYGFWRDKSWKE
jgi:hypothetical protein